MKKIEKLEEGFNNRFEDYEKGLELWFNEETAHFDFLYPPYEIEESNGKIRYLEVNIETVRASDGIRIHYDFDRDGFVIEQPMEKEIDKGDYIECEDEWHETSFIKSWALEKESNEEN